MPEYMLKLEEVHISAYLNGALGLAKVVVDQSEISASDPIELNDSLDNIAPQTQVLLS